MSDSFLTNQHYVVRLVILVALSNHRQVCRVVVRLFESRRLHQVTLLTQIVLQGGRNATLVTCGFIRHLVLASSDEGRDAVFLQVPQTFVS